MQKIYWIISFFLVLGFSISAQEKELILNSKKVAIVPIAKTEPFIDGKLSDEVWLQSLGFPLNLIKDHTKAPYDKTAVKISATKTHLYVSFLCEESRLEQLQIKASKADDDMSKDDCVSVLLCPGLDAVTKTYLITVNSNGIIYDSFNKDKSWNWDEAKVAVAKNEKSWSVELALPLAVFEKDLKKIKVKGWRANFYRLRPERGWEDTVTSSWSSVEGGYPFDAEQAGYAFISALGETQPANTVLANKMQSEFEYHGLMSIKVPALDKNEINIDGDIREQISGGAALLSFRRLDTKPDAIASLPLTNKTEAWLCTVKDSLVVSVRCYDESMNRLVSSEKIRDSGSAWSDDSVEVFLKIGEEESSAYYHIGVNASGTIYDAFDGKPQWNGNNIKAVVNRTDNYWDLEMQIPFDDLDKEKIKASNNQPWRFNLVRHRPSHESNEEMQEAAWSPTYSNKSHVPSRFGYIFMDVLNASSPK